jgi:hypothetical protein
VSDCDHWGAPPLLAAIADVNAALGRLKLLVEHRGGVVLASESIGVLAIVDRLDVILAGNPPTLRTRFTRSPSTEIPLNSALGLGDSGEKGLNLAPVNGGDDVRFPVVGIEADADGAGEPVLNRHDARVGAVDDDRVQSDSPRETPDATA